MRAFLLAVLPLALAQPPCNKYFLGSLFEQSAGYDEKNSVECTCDHSGDTIEWGSLDWPGDQQSPLSATCAEGEYCLVGVGDAICSATPIARCENEDGTRSNEGACMCTDGQDGQLDIICAPPFNYCDYSTDLDHLDVCRPYDEACNNPSACGGADRRETCTVVPSQQKHICTCKTGYSGEHCEVGPCTDAPCKNGGTCTNDAASYRCDCLGGWSGPTCEVAPPTGVN